MAVAVRRGLLAMVYALLVTADVLASITASPDEDRHQLSLVRSTTSKERQEETVLALLRRTIGQSKSDLFDIRVDPSLRVTEFENRDGFRIQRATRNDTNTTSKYQISIIGTTGYATANGLNYYIRKFLRGQVTWSGKRISVPDSLPVPNDPLAIPLVDQVRYYSNVCTQSYSMVWWSWPRWEREIDWLALNGINLPLAFNGQEFVSAKIFKQMGCNETDLEAYFSGPAFLAWNRMGNLRGWGGPLPPAWRLQQRYLQHAILNRMRSFGMTPVLPGFNGFLPRAFERLFPKVNFTRASRWSNFPDRYAMSTFIPPTEPFYANVSARYIAAYANEYGSDHLYNIDLFNELEPNTNDVNALNNMGRTVYESMNLVDNKSIWVMQGWQFENDPVFWTTDRVKALLTGPPIGRMLILDLFSEQAPQYDRYSNYFGQPFVWCMLHNYGGVDGLFGNLSWVDGPLHEARARISNLVGIGMTPEGSGQNEIMYEFMAENSYRNSTENITKWVQEYAEARYGIVDEHISEAWHLLQSSVYGLDDLSIRNHGEYILTRRPQVVPPRKPKIWYNSSEVLRAADILLHASWVNGRLCTQPLFHEDLVDIVRQAFQLRIAEEYTKMMLYHFLENADQFELHSRSLLNCINVLDEVLATDPNFLVGSWIADARKSAGPDPKLKDLFEFNARNQITRWGPNGQILDYASKMWAGVTRDYYGERWRVFIQTLDEAIKKGTPVDADKLAHDIENKAEIPFASNLHNTTYPAKRTGNACALRPKIRRALFPGTHQWLGPQ